MFFAVLAPRFTQPVLVLLIGLLWGVLAPAAQGAVGLQADLLIGQRALGIGEPTRALMAFERCLARQPDQDTCRLGLARAHLALYEFPQARQALLSITDPALRSQTEALTAEYQQALASQLVVLDQATHFNAWIQAGLGYDSNANAATTADRIDLPSFRWIVLSPSSQRQGSFFHQTELGLDYATALNARWRLLTTASLRTRNYWTMHEVDSVQADLSLGAQYIQDKHRSTFRTLGQYAGLGAHDYRNLLGVTAEYAYRLTDRFEIGPYAQYFWMQYPGRRWMNAQRGIVGLRGSLQLFDGRALAFAYLYGGRESASSTLAPDALSQDIVGGRLGALWQFSARTRLEAGVGVEHRRYDGNDALFIVSRDSPSYALNQQYPMTRADTQVSAWLGFNYAINRRMSLQPRYQYVHANSDLLLRTYRRHVIAIDLRYEFF